jgi:isocitrate dehydrogenase
MSDQTLPDIIYTKTDEAPQLASASLLPILRKFLSEADISIGTKDISLAGRILAVFPENLTEAQRVPDDLALLGGVVKEASANVIKLPNVSASVPQLVTAARELQDQGYNIPDYPEAPETAAEIETRKRYDAIKGSAVNPVLREGNSDRRAPSSVKAYARANPHRMGKWSPDSKTRVSMMSANDFFSNETSVTLSNAQADGPLRIELTATDGSMTTLKDGIEMPAGTIVDATFLSVKALKTFFHEQIAATKDQGTLFSLHMKATMMKVSDPIIFGHAVVAYLQPVFDKHADAFAAAGISPNAGFGSLFKAIDALPNGADIRAEIDALLAERPPLYMVNSDRGITNLHVPSDVIIDASMPAIIRAGGKGWGPDGNEGDTNCVIPDSSYAPVYDASVEFCKANGALDPVSAGTVQNVGLMAQKAEEYGSHPTTFEIPEDGTVRVIAANGDVLHGQAVEAGDIWRMASARRRPIENWIQLAIDRMTTTGFETIFWLDRNRAHDAQLLAYVEPVLARLGLTDKVKIMAPREATTRSFEVIYDGQNTIAVTGNVLRDYLTDLFPILEVGTSAKMLSVVKLMEGGGLFETGAGGSAPKHVEQLVKENHLRWDSLGEFCALAESLRFLATSQNKPAAGILGDAVDTATEKLLSEGHSPQRKVGQPDNRDSHYWFARFWAEALATQTNNAEVAARYAPLAAKLTMNEAAILAELSAARGTAVDLKGYYNPPDELAAAAMRPSATLNGLIG